MKKKILYSRFAMIFPVLVVPLLLALRAPAVASDFTFSSPQAGSTHHIGDILRIQFSSTDTSVRLFRDMIGLSINNGKSWLYFNLALNGEDSISKRGYYDWTIPDSISAGRNSSVSIISDSCRVCIASYQTSHSRGESELFIIRDSAASLITVSRKTVFERRPEVNNVKPGINLTRTGGPSPFFSIDGRLHAIINPGSRTMPGLSRGTGIIIIP